MASLAESAKKLEEQAGSAGGAGGAGGDSEAVLEKLLEQFGSNTEFQGMMENMVQQLMSKDIMYGPLKEMRDKVRAALCIRRRVRSPRAPLCAVPRVATKEQRHAQRGRPGALPEAGRADRQHLRSL